MYAPLPSTHSGNDSLPAQIFCTVVTQYLCWQRSLNERETKTGRKRQCAPTYQNIIGLCDKPLDYKSCSLGSGQFLECKVCLMDFMPLPTHSSEDIDCSLHPLYPAAAKGKFI